MAIAIGLIGGLFIMLALALLGAGFRNPRWLILVVCLILALYKYGAEQLETNSQHITVAARYSPACEPAHIQVRISNNGTSGITHLGFNVKGFRPNHSTHVAQRYHSTDRVIPSGQSWTSCWRILALDNVPVAQHPTLRWESRVTSVRLAN